MAIETTNPATGQVIERFAPRPAEDVDAALTRADVAYRAWRQRPVGERATVLGRAAAVLETDVDRLASIMTLEMGKLSSAAREEVQKCAAGLRHYAENLDHYLADEFLQEPGGIEERVLFQPLGPILAVMPWNFPFWQVIRFAAPALGAGNVGLLKHAANVPRCALALEDVFRRAGAPEGVFQTLLIESDAVAGVIADDRVVAVTLTGSDRAGRSVAGTAGRHLKKSVLELGGSDPFVVLPSADLDAVVAMAVKARMVNSGQSCIAAKRFIVADPIYDRFRDRFVAAVAALVVGDPDRPETQVGPLATAAIRDGLAGQVRRSVEAGARLLTGGTVPERPGFFYTPTVLEAPPEGSPAACEELFGPVATLWRVRDTTEAIQAANDTVFGLGASVWTRDAAEQERCLREIEAGMVVVNDMVVSDPRFPFGGIKQSGYGRELGVWGLREFVNVKRVRIVPATGANPEARLTSPRAGD
jgi:succinate-semialdehyde dehydrogenase / glutarate-semialdehyde dehydrogenase